MTTRSLAASLALLAGCGPPAAPTDATANVAIDAAPDTTSATGYEAIQVGARGITVIGADGISTEVGLGTPAQAAQAALLPSLGAPTSEGAYEACGADPGMHFVTWSDGLTLNVGSNGTVDGWQAEGDNELIQTVSGVQLGAPLSMTTMADSTFERVEGSTLDGEFMLGEEDAEGNRVAGFMSGTGDGATVTALHSGATCVAR